VYAATFRLQPFSDLDDHHQVSPTGRTTDHFPPDRAKPSRSETAEQRKNHCTPARTTS